VNRRQRKLEAYAMALFKLCIDGIAHTALAWAEQLADGPQKYEEKQQCNQRADDKAPSRAAQCSRLVQSRGPSYGADKRP